MSARFRARQLAHDLGGNLFLRPAVIALSLAAAAIVLTEIDERRGGEVLLGALVREPAAAQALLAAVAGSVMGVVSIVYSVLVMSLTMASMQFSPRILAGFLRDRISQNVLGIFTGTFLYCLATLRSVRSDPPFVPTLALTGGVFLALASIAALIYFISHMAREIQVNHVIARISHETAAAIEVELPHGPGEDVAPPAPPAVAGVEVRAPRGGYVQLIDDAGLAALARRRGLRIDVAAVPGDFVPRGGLLARIVPGADDDTAGACVQAFDLGPVRTLQQDVAFGLRQIVDIGLKAISPAMNDPSTCSTCVDHLGDLLGQLSGRRAGARVIRDGEEIRLVVPLPTFGDFLDLAFNQLRQYGRGDLAVANRIMRALVEIAGGTGTAARRSAVLQQARLVMEGLSPGFPREDRLELEARYRVLVP